MEKLKKNVLQAVTTGATQGYWNASTNTPNIASISSVGYMWNVSVAGNTTLNGISGETITGWTVSDWAVKYSGGWGKVNVELDNYTGATGNILIVPDLMVGYNFKIGLKQEAKDLGFMDVSSYQII